MPKFNITTEEVWPHKVFYVVTAKTLEAAMERIRKGDVEYHDQRIGDITGDSVVGVYEIKQNGKSLDVPVYLVGECAVTGEKTTPERRLADFWRSRAGIPYSEFDRLIGSESPAHEAKPVIRAMSRREPIDFNLNPDVTTKGYRNTRDMRDGVQKQLYDDVDSLREYVARGLPLSRREYYMALAMGYLMGDLPYEEFFQTHWFETAQECGLGRYEDKIKNS
jgi:hypothetical protein